MRIIIILGIVTMAISTAVNQFYTSHTPADEGKWTLFKTEFNITYDNEIKERFRKMIFFKNIEFIAKHNELYRYGLKSYELEINAFSDLTHEEFVERMGGFNGSNVETNSKKLKRYIASTNIEIPGEIDYRARGYVTPVQNQGLCSSCWAFSATGALEGQMYASTKILTPLSAQNLIDCSSPYGNDGCMAGTVRDAFNYVTEVGIEAEASYPYTAEQGICQFNIKKKVATAYGFMDMEPKESTLEIAVASLGPISAVIDDTQKDFQFYKSGVYYNPDCSALKIRHAVLIVGYGTDKLMGDYWIVKNSWGTGWGIKGYVLMARNKDNNCGIATLTSVPFIDYPEK